MADANTSESQVRQIKAIIDKVRPDRVDVNTVTRPPTDVDARPVDSNTLERLRAILGPIAQTISPYAARSLRPGKLTPDEVVAMLTRRPCTIDDMVEVFGCHRLELAKLLASLREEGLITSRFRDNKLYYLASKNVQG